MLVAYFLMHLTFVSLYLNMRKLGSRFWLGESTNLLLCSASWFLCAYSTAATSSASSVLVSSVFGFICSLFVAYLLNLTVNPVTLSEALPFMVVVIGFEKPFILARTVFSNPAAVTAYNEPVRSSSSAGAGGEDRRMRSSLSFITEEATVLTQTRESKPAQDIVAEAVKSNGARIVRDYAIEIVVLLVGALSNVKGLTEFCQFGALVLAVDCASLFTLYIAFLTVILEVRSKLLVLSFAAHHRLSSLISQVRRIRSMRSIGRKASTTDLATILDDESTPAGPPENLTLKQTFLKLLTGSGPGEKITSETSTSRLKLLLIAVFIGLHVLNLCTPLSTHFRLPVHGLSASNSAAPMTPSLKSMLQQLSALYPADTPILAHVRAPILIKMAPVGVDADSWASAAESFSAVSPLGLLDWVFTAWSKLTSDPVMSKWISLALGISVFLNGYLLKGIALGSSRAEAAESAARILLAATGQLSSDDAKPGKILRRHSLGADSLPVVRKQYSRRFQEAPIDEEPRSRSSSQSSVSGQPETVAAAIPVVTKSELSSDSNTINGRSGISTATLEKPIVQISSVSSTTASSSVISDNGASTPATTAIDSEDGAVFPAKARPFEDCAKLFDDGQAFMLSDEEIIILVQRGKVAAYSLEKLLKDHQRAVRIRRALICELSSSVSRSFWG